MGVKIVWCSNCRQVIRIERPEAGSEEDDGTKETTYEKCQRCREGKTWTSISPAPWDGRERRSEEREE